MTTTLYERQLEREIERLRRFLTRIASPDEMTGDGPTEEMTGPAAYEMRARMHTAQRGLDGDEYLPERLRSLAHVLDTRGLNHMAKDDLAEAADELDRRAERILQLEYQVRTFAGRIRRAVDEGEGVFASRQTSIVNDGPIENEYLEGA